MSGPPPTGSHSRPASLLERLENWFLLLVFGAAILLPLSETVGRRLGGFHLPNSAAYLRASVLWLTFVGAVIASREKGHIGLSLAEVLAKGKWRRALNVFACAVAAAVSALLAWASLEIVKVDVGTGGALFGFVPEWVNECVMPIALVSMAGIFVWEAGRGTSGRSAWADRGVALAAVGLAFGLQLIPGAPSLGWPLVLVVLGATLAGAPVFVAMTGVALALYFRQGTSISEVTTEVFGLLGSPTIPAIPLLTGAGYVLAESKAASRLVRLLRAMLGSVRGGIAVSVILLLALFTTFTGGSGVTILAMGGLAYGILREDGNGEGFSLGTVTTAGSLGLLFPPSIPVILYSVVGSVGGAAVPADLLYLAGALPGLIMVLVVAGYALFQARGIGAADRSEEAFATQPFRVGELFAALKEAGWELTVPLVVLGLFFSGLASMVEAAAAAFAWTIIVECFITRDIHPVKDLPRVLRHATILVGAVLLLLTSARGFAGYLVDIQAVDALRDFATAHVHSKFVFLLLLNVALLILGSVFEIYAAIVVLAPIVAPLGVAFGVEPIHLGVIFLANLELGFLLPPAGMNLFLSSSRFGVSLPRLYRVIVPFLLIQAGSVLLITYATPLTVGVLHFFHKA